jgi:probable HAF family extracellular repeat protein
MRLSLFLARCISVGLISASVVAAAAADQLPPLSAGSLAAQNSSITLLTPGDGQTFTAPTNILFSAAGSLPPDQVREIRFFARGQLLAVVTNEPYEFVWRNLSAGDLCVRAVVVDQSGATASSSQACIRIEANLSHAPRYALTDLGLLTVWQSRALAINSAGQVAGTGGRDGSTLYPFVYTRGHIEFLPQSGYAQAINDLGEVAGTSGMDSFFYSAGEWHRLRSPDPSGSSGVRGMNNLGQIAGWADIRGIRHAVVYWNGELTDLGRLNGAESDATAINDTGQVVGWIALEGAARAFIYDSTNGMRLLAFPGAEFSRANAINNAGEIAGERRVLSGYQEAYLLRGQQLEALGTLGGFRSYALALNHSNQVVGYAENEFSRERAFLWEDHVLYDLNELVHNLSDWTLVHANAINDAGQVVGWGRRGLAAEVRAFLLTPMPRAGESNQPPVITVASPLPGSEFFATEDVVIEAAAFDPDGEVAQVKFYAGSTWLGTVTNRPYRITWPTVDAGTYTLRAEATDLLGKTWSSEPVTIEVAEVDPDAPAVAVLAVASALVNDDVRTKIRSTGLFRRVDVYDVSRDMPLPSLSQLQAYQAVLVYSTDLFNSSIGIGNRLADYVDQGGGVVVAAFSFSRSYSGLEGRLATGDYLPWSKESADSGVELTLVPSVASHTVLTDVRSFHGGRESFHHRTVLASSATLIASWSNGRPLVAIREKNGGRVAGLNFFPASSDVHPNYWRAETDGGRLMANALIWAARVPQPVTVQLTGPAAGTLFYPGEPIPLRAEAASSSGQMSHVSFYAGTNLIDTATNAPYMAKWTNAPVGAHSLSAVAFDRSGRSAGSPPITVQVRSRMNVNLSSPRSGIIMYMPTNITYLADVTNLDAAVLRVEFFVGLNEKKGEATSPPYTAVWPNVGVGTHVLTARATDSLGVIVTSAPVSVTVINPANPVETAWKAGTASWIDPGNWSNRVPLGQDTAVVDNGGTAEIRADSAQMRRLRVGRNLTGRVAVTTGQLMVAEEMILGDSAGSSGSLILSSSGEVFAAVLGLGNQGTGRVVQTGGKIRVDDLWMVGSSTAQARYVLLGGHLLSRHQHIASGDAVFQHNNGTNTVETALILGSRRAGGTATYELRGGRLTLPILRVGDSGPGHFQQSGGTNQVQEELVIGHYDRGDYTISGGLLSARDFIVNGSLIIQSAQAQLLASNRLVFGGDSLFEGVPDSSILLLGAEFDVTKNLPQYLSGISNLALVVGGTNLTRLEAAGSITRGFESNIVLGSLTLGATGPVRAELVNRRLNDRNGSMDGEAFMAQAINWFFESALDLKGLPLIVRDPVDLAGELVLSGGRIAAPRLHVASEGVVRTGGRIEAEFVNSGRITLGPEPRLLDVRGSFEQTPSGTLEVTVDGLNPSEFERIVVDGPAQLAGRLKVRLGPNFAATPRVLPILLAAEVSGRFVEAELPAPAEGIGWRVHYGTNAVYLEAVATPVVAIHPAEWPGWALEFSTNPGNRYYIEYSEDLTHWTLVPEPVPGTGVRTVWNDLNVPAKESSELSPARRFYRIRMIPE